MATRNDMMIDASKWLIPVGLIVLAAFGVVWLVRNVGNSTPPPS